MKHILLSLLFIAVFSAESIENNATKDMQICVDLESDAIRAWTEQKTEDGAYVILTIVSRKIGEIKFTACAIQSDANSDIKSTRMKKIEPNAILVEKLKRSIRQAVRSF